MREFTRTEVHRAAKLAQNHTGYSITDTEGEAMNCAPLVFRDLRQKHPGWSESDYADELIRIMFDAGRMLGKREERERRAARAAQEGTKCRY